MAEPKVKPEFMLTQGAQVGKLVKDTLLPVVARVMVCGSVRRRRRTVHDVDVVVEPMPGDEGRVQLAKAMLSICEVGTLTAPEKIWKCRVGEMPVELYLATPETYHGLLVVRTGSASHNVLVASTARRMGLQWKASGEGFLDSSGQLIPVRSEEDVFRTLGWRYKMPETREA